jgi:deazaflavin-dependent oxidoreductase (nitroreductase family)
MLRLGVKIQGRPLLRMTTIGARTGESRRVVLGWFPDEDRNDAWLVVASNSGSARHPGWAYNLAENPNRALVDFGEGPIAIEPELLTGPERDSSWNRIVELAPGYGRYDTKTDREIPVFRLTRRRP